MERIRTREGLLQRLRDLRAVEINARRRYEEDVLTFRNFEIRDAIQKIREDEERHVMMLEELISMLEV